MKLVSLTFNQKIQPIGLSEDIYLISLRIKICLHSLHLVQVLLVTGNVGQILPFKSTVSPVHKAIVVESSVDFCE